MAELYNINNFIPQYLLPRDCKLIQSLIREEVLFLSIENMTLDDVDDDDENFSVGRRVHLITEGNNATLIYYSPSD